MPFWASRARAKPPPLRCCPPDETHLRRRDGSGRSVVTEPDRVKELLGISPRETAVAPNLTVRENLELMCGLYGHGRAESRQKATDMMNSFSLTEVERSRAKTLSGGNP